MAKKKVKKLSLQHRAFCVFYVLGGESFRMGHGGQSYAAAYKKDYFKSRASCDDAAYKLLRKSEILEECKRINETNGFNDTTMDARLREIAILGKDQDSIRAISEYNKQQDRITHKIDMTSKGRPIQSVMLNLKQLPDEQTEGEAEEIFDEISEE